jgi:hypothetical protein
MKRNVLALLSNRPEDNLLQRLGIKRKALVIVVVVQAITLQTVMLHVA